MKTGVWYTLHCVIIKKKQIKANEHLKRITKQYKQNPQVETALNFCKKLNILKKLNKLNVKLSSITSTTTTTTTPSPSHTAAFATAPALAPTTPLAALAQHSAAATTTLTTNSPPSSTAAPLAPDNTNQSRLPFPLPRYTTMNKTTLHWSYLNFKDVPMDLYLYEDLEEVYLKENFITSIPKWLLNVTTLKFIHLAGNNLSALPEEMYLLENLEFLDVSNNQIRHLPQTIGLMIRLQRLNVSGNELTELPAAIGALKCLEQLNISKNQLKRLPIQLSECQRLNELNLSDNASIWHIPERISNLQSLQSISADRCALIYLPVALSKFLNYIRIFHNTSITHVPMVYEKFFQTFYDNRSKVTPMLATHASFFWVLEKETYTKLLLPIGTRRVFPIPSQENRVTLYDDCLRAVQYLNRYMPLYDNVALHRMLPEKFMVDHIVNGPIARCTVFTCANPLYTTYYFMVVKRRGSTSKQLFTCNFCSHHCANLWLQDNAKKYYQIDWEVCED